MNNKKYIVIGALEDGIGEAITKDLLTQGYNVVGTFEQNTLKEKVSEYTNISNLELFEVNHSDLSSLKTFVSKIKGNSFDGIINVQMFFNMENLKDFDYTLWNKSLAINLTAPNFLIHELKSQMNNPSSIVIITSIEGFIGSFGASAYASTKSAMHNLVMTHANNLGQNNIRINAIAAGWIGGVMDTDEIFNMSRKITPLGRLGTPEEIASITNFLLSEKSSFIHGTTIKADGGYSCVDSISKFEFEAEEQ